MITLKISRYTCETIIELLSNCKDHLFNSANATIRSFMDVDITQKHFVQSKLRVHRFPAIHDVSVKCSPLYRISFKKRKRTFNQLIT